MKRNKYSLSNYKLLTADMGQLIPINCIEVLPGDSIQQATSLLMRVSPLMAPVMHPVQVRVHHWYVPLSQIWADFEKFITGGPDGNDNTSPPYQEGTPGQGTLCDYLGLPVRTTQQTQRYSVLPLRAYHKIWDEFYRDQDLQATAEVPTSSGADVTDYNIIRRVCWEKDYFTAARPWTQKGDDISLGFGDSAEVVSNQEEIKIKEPAGSETSIGIDNNEDLRGFVAGSSTGMIFGSQTGLEADLSTATAVTINQLREAFALQRYAEARSKYGSRYTEYLRYLGVRSSDARLNRPEYLGGGKQTIQFSEVLQTGPETGGGGVGNMAGHGISAMRTNRYRRFFEEHGIILSLLSVRPKTIYAQGLSKMWTRWTKEDYHQKELEGIGQAEIFNREVYTDHSAPNEVFGYQDRYDEYRRSESMVHAEFKNELDHWHMARIFAGDVALNEDFVECNPTKRIHAAQDNNTLWIMANNSIQARRLVGR